MFNLSIEQDEMSEMFYLSELYLSHPIYDMLLMLAFRPLIKAYEVSIFFMFVEAETLM